MAADPIVSYSEQMTREEPYMEAMRRGLMQDVRGLQANRFGYNLVNKTDPTTGEVLKDAFGYPIKSYEKMLDEAGQWVGPAYEPDYQVAELTPEQQQASAQAQQVTGSFLPTCRVASRMSSRGSNTCNRHGDWQDSPAKILTAINSPLPQDLEPP